MKILYLDAGFSIIAAMTSRRSGERFAINLRPREYIVQVQEYSVSLNVTNISGQPISDLQVFNTLSAGRELSINDEFDVRII
ncbi:hypothetical protein OH492_18095 [Vibrio chagasii]|nr:hypothetical protein [Vibrio chagasii]